eukprot:gnl/MRDRNA2_/MRDRNA2_60380_c0_seq1.p1 gnl/MRDRNA2_/MRDRNA2_60380_c0~~gnl/MRDRNA2_/MRDRNA2_60380_c0_seq1.p1  ORF type:complete len:921 (+),score=184.48 gnl/MRDRNA2_/MRDRNA2_60380_c0_seq1:252-2765(+)
MGAAGFHTAHLKKQNFNWESTKHVALLLNKWRDQKQGIQGDDDDGVLATSIQINFNFAGPMHIDGNNWGDSDIIGLGDYTGGKLIIEDDQNWTCERELISVSSGSGSWAPARHPGIYRCRIEDVKLRFFRFQGNTQLHGAQPTKTGVRITLVWFSLSPTWVSRLSVDDQNELRLYGFRPRPCVDPKSVPPPIQRQNDHRTYPPGFLFYSRKCRAEVEVRLRNEGKATCQDATEILHAQWATLRDGNEEHQRGWYARLEEIERQSQKANSKSKKAHEMRVASPQFNRPAATTTSNIHDNVLVDLVNDEDSADDNAEDETNDFNLEAFAGLVLDQFPNALRDTDIFISVLDEFGIANEEDVRSRALEIVKAMKRSRSDEELARRIEEADRSGDPHASEMIIEDSDTSLSLGLHNEEVDEVNGFSSGSGMCKRLLKQELQSDTMTASDSTSAGSMGGAPVINAPPLLVADNLSRQSACPAQLTKSIVQPRKRLKLDHSPVPERHHETAQPAGEEQEACHSFSSSSASRIEQPAISQWQADQDTASRRTAKCCGAWWVVRLSRDGSASKLPWIGTATAGRRIHSDVFVGSGQDCLKVSGTHCMFHCNKGEPPDLEDCSTNGTRVNGVSVLRKNQRRRLAENDIIQMAWDDGVDTETHNEFGPVQYQLEWREESAMSESVASKIICTSQKSPAVSSSGPGSPQKKNTEISSSSPEVMMALLNSGLEWQSSVDSLREASSRREQIVVSDSPDLQMITSSFGSAGPLTEQPCDSVSPEAMLKHAGAKDDVDDPSMDKILAAFVDAGLATSLQEAQQALSDAGGDVEFAGTLLLSAKAAEAECDN